MNLNAVNIFASDKVSNLITQWDWLYRMILNDYSSDNHEFIDEVKILKHVNSYFLTWLKDYNKFNLPIDIFGKILNVKIYQSEYNIGTRRSVYYKKYNKLLILGYAKIKIEKLIEPNISMCKNFITIDENADNCLFGIKYKYHKNFINSYSIMKISPKLLNNNTNNNFYFKFN